MNLCIQLTYAVTSPAQLLHRRIVCRADLLTTKHCKMIRKACAEFCESIKVSLSRLLGWLVELFQLY